MNAINMLDNMDAITSVISISVVVTIIINLFIQGDYSNPDLFVLVGILAALIGFLRYNWNPSTIYMGDTGSQFLGAFLAAYGIIYFWNRTEVHGAEIWSKQIIAAVLVFSIPIIDTTTVVIKRLRKGKSPFVGGKDHTTHHVSYLGYSDRQVAIIYSVISAINVILAVFAINVLKEWSRVYTILYGIYFIGMFFTLFVIANKNIRKGK
jgi:UDP-GlcNAc:undecaprenyl-phosphate GlcNAc-1-phosphate transferase